MHGEIPQTRWPSHPHPGQWPGVFPATLPGKYADQHCGVGGVLQGWIGYQVTVAKTWIIDYGLKIVDFRLIVTEQSIIYHRCFSYCCSFSTNALMCFSRVGCFLAGVLLLISSRTFYLLFINTETQRLRATQREISVMSLSLYALLCVALCLCVSVFPYPMRISLPPPVRFVPIPTGVGAGSGRC